jgi:hypothetical protein
MSFNFNKTQKPEVTLFKNNIKELIHLYGVEINYVCTTKMNKDKVLNDFSHMVSNNETETIFLLPENTADWDNELQWNVFGLDNLRTLAFFMDSDTYDMLQERFNTEIINDLLITPSRTILEITDIDYDFESGNNLFLYGDKKTVYRIVTKVYQSSKQDEIEIDDNPATDNEVDVNINDGLIEVDHNYDEIQDKAFQNLENYFEELSKKKEEQDEEGKNIVDSESVFGSLG